jgi:putative salt-induced outer membrane protein
MDFLRLSVTTTLATGLLALPAMAQDGPRWTGEGSVSAGFTTGNTETTDAAIGVKAAREGQIWSFGVEARGEYGEDDGTENQNRIFLAGNADRQISDRLFGYGRVSYERDEFSGYESRAFIGGGLGYQAIDNEQTQWTLRGGPGIKIDEIRARVDPGPVIVPATTEESFAVNLGSDFDHAFNDNVAFSNDTQIVYAETSTQLQNVAALTAKLTDALSARVSFDVRHDTEPQGNFEQTDTATRFSLVYAF